MSKEIKVPYTKDGSMAHSVWSNRDIIWVDNIPFDDRLEFLRVGDWVEFRKTDGGVVFMGLTEFNRIIPKMKDGYLIGKFKIKKIGRMYNIVMINEE